MHTHVARTVAALTPLAVLAGGAFGQSVPSLTIPDEPERSVDLSGYIQFRYNATFRDGEDTATGFQLPRVRLKVTADLSETLGVQVEGGLEGGEAELKDAFVRFSPEGQIEYRAGQFKLPFTRETIVSDSAQLAMTPSATNAVFTLGRGQGLMADWRADRLRLIGSVNDGAGTDNTNYTAPEEAEVALTARAEVRLGEADWKRYASFTSFPDSSPGVLLGAAVHWQSGDDLPMGDAIDPDLPPEFLSATADISYEGDGHTAFLAGYWRRIDEGDEDFDDFGIVFQGGIFVAEKSELFARYGVVIPDGDREADDPFHEIAVGLNHYFVPDSQVAKLVVEAVYYPEGTEDNALVGRSTDRGVLTSDDEQLTLRAQIQVMF